MLWYVGGLSKVKNFWSYFQLVWSLLFNSFQNVTIKHCGYWYGGYFYIVCDWSQDWLGSLITIRYHSETMGRFLWLRLVPGCKAWRSRDKFLCLLGHWYNTWILNQTSVWASLRTAGRRGFHCFTVQYEQASDCSVNMWCLILICLASWNYQK